MSELFSDLAEPPTIPMSCLGMDLDGVWEEGTVPIEAFVIVKTIRDGDFSYLLMSTRELNTIECLGMIRYATLILETGILQRAEPTEEQSD